MKNLRRLTASQEDYLETIYHIIEKKQVARAKEIATCLKVSRSSVTEAFRSLAKKGLINYTPYEVITLTPGGETIARDVIARHSALKDFFTKVLDVDDEIAESGACKIEHTAPGAIIERLIQFVKFIEENPDEGNGWVERFKAFCAPPER